MKSLNYVKIHLDEFEEDEILGRRFTKRFLAFIPVNEWVQYGFSYVGTDDIPSPKPWSRSAILDQLRKDVKFGIKKAVQHKAISSALMESVVVSWCKILEDGLENTKSGYYGSELFKAVDNYYGFGLVTEDTFDSGFYKDW